MYVKPKAFWSLDVPRNSTICPFSVFYNLLSPSPHYSRRPTLDTRVDQN